MVKYVTELSGVVAPLSNNVIYSTSSVLVIPSEACRTTGQTKLTVPSTIEIRTARITALNREIESSFLLHGVFVSFGSNFDFMDYSPCKALFKQNPITV